jgi:hypothetical protein
VRNLLFKYFPSPAFSPELNFGALVLHFRVGDQFIRTYILDIAAVSTPVSQKGRITIAAAVEMFLAAEGTPRDN